MSFMLVVLNVLVLSGLFILLIGEELRYRKFSRRVETVRGTLTSLAHGLRTPLASIRMYNLFLRGKYVGKPSLAEVEILSKMDAATSESVVIVNRLLAVSRLEEAEIAPRAENTDLRACLRGAIDAVDGLVRERGQRLTSTLPRRPVRLFADPLLLHGILDELLLNAVIYSPRKRRIIVAMRAGVREVTIGVRDHGIGISKADQPLVTHQFFRGERAKKMYPQGTGLGLCFAKDFTERLGGRLSFHSRTDKGSVFTITLPIKRYTGRRAGKA